MSLQPDESSAVPSPDPRDTVENVDDAAPAAGELGGAAQDTGDDGADKMLAYLQEAREKREGQDEMPVGLLTTGAAFRKFKTEQDEAEALDPGAPDRAPSSAGSYSTPDDTPSLRVRGCRWTVFVLRWLICAPRVLLLPRPSARLARGFRRRRRCGPSIAAFNRVYSLRARANCCRPERNRLLY